jgi:hypothetical protein
MQRDIPITKETTRKTMPGLLSTFQRDAIADTLRALEESLWQLDGLLLGLEENRILNRRKLGLTSDQRLMARGVVATTLNQIEELKEILALETREENPAKRIAVQLIHHRNSLKSRLSEKLSLLGEIDPALAEVLDQYLDRLALLSLGLSKIIES